MALTKIPASLLDTSSGINGLIYPTSDGTSGQFLKTDGSGNLTFATVTTYTDSDVETYLDGGSSTPTFASATVSGTLTVTGDLDITGDINSYNVTDLDVTDKTITLGAGQTEANSGGSGIIIDGSSASILWDETNDKFDLSHGLHIGDSNAVGDATTPALQIGGTNTYRLGLYTNSEGGIIENKNGDDGLQFRVKTAGEAMRIDASGKVGIGETSPETSLHIKNAGNSFLTLERSGTTGGTGKFGINMEGGSSQQTTMAYDDGGKLVIGRSSDPATMAGFSNDFILDSSGDVLIGQTSQTGYAFAQKLVVGDGDNNDGITIQSGSTHQGNLAFNHSDGTTAHGRISYQHQTNYMQFFTDNTERMRIDSSGNVGIGETSPAKLGLTGSSAGKVLHLGGDDCQLRLANSILHHDNSGNTTLHLRNNYGATSNYAQTKIESGFTTFHTGTAFTERMRILADGGICMNVPGRNNGAPEVLNIYGSGSGGGYGINIKCIGSGGGTMLRFNTAGNIVGQIYTSSNATTYATSSDRRLKDITGTARGLEVINALNPVAYNWKVDGSADEGLIAQEVESIVPNATHVSKADDDSNGMYSMDYSKLVVHLIAGMKEQQTIIDDLKSRIETLEG